jgi:hypothetical protein
MRKLMTDLQWTSLGLTVASPVILLEFWQLLHAVDEVLHQLSGLRQSQEDIPQVLAPPCGGWLCAAPATTQRDGVQFCQACAEDLDSRIAALP